MLDGLSVPHTLGGNGRSDGACGLKSDCLTYFAGYEWRPAQTFGFPLRFEASWENHGLCAALRRLRNATKWTGGMIQERWAERKERTAREGLGEARDRIIKR